MLRTLATLTTVAAVSACSSTPDSTPLAATPPTVPGDAGIDAITAIGAYDPASGAHLDDDGSGAPVVRAKPTRAGRPIEITLRSSPPGADAYVDGVKLGPTPAFWQGEANGTDHEFAFTMRAHATARYRFVPVASGVVHGRLEPVIANDPAADTAPPRPAPPAPAPAKLQPPAPPPTLVSPVPRPPPDAAPVVPPPDVAEPTGPGPQP